MTVQPQKEENMSTCQLSTNGVRCTRPATNKITAVVDHVGKVDLDVCRECALPIIQRAESMISIGYQGRSITHVNRIETKG